MIPQVRPAFIYLLLLSYVGHVAARNSRLEETFEVAVASLLPSPTCSRNHAHNHSTAQIIHRHGPCSSKRRGKHNHVKSLARDVRRVTSIHEAISSAGHGNTSVVKESHVSVSAKNGVYLGSGNYVITVGFGNPVTTQTVTFDTGSNLNWIQCQPCSGSCYPQEEPLFNPALSSTYRSIGCTDSDCLRLGPRFCSDNKCVYQVNYGDGSSSVGFLSRDTFTLTPTNVFENFVFGCGERNTGLFRGAAGLIGLGRSAYSLNSQGASRLGRSFSYCLPSTDSGTGYLNLGNPLSPPMAFTQVQDDSRAPSLYFVDLVGISVGNKRLSLMPYVFQSVGTIIDSGTVITRLPPVAYSALREAFRSAMAQYSLATPPISLFDTCYDFSSSPTVRYPPIKLHLSGVDLTLPASGVFYTFGVAQVCLAFAANSDANQLGIIGNVQQKTFEVTYDNVVNKIGFSAGACG
ncbi:aspartyl protease family protein At5g10770-like [Wolffia australiana]